MPSGGKRPGAGRKPVLPNHDTRSIRKQIDTEKLISELQDMVFQGRGELSNSERLAAIKILLSKTMPDLQAMKLSGDPEAPIVQGLKLKFDDMTEEELNEYLEEQRKKN